MLVTRVFTEVLKSYLFRISVGVVLVWFGVFLVFSPHLHGCEEPLLMTLSSSIFGGSNIQPCNTEAKSVPCCVPQISASAVVRAGAGGTLGLAPTCKRAGCSGSATPCSSHGGVGIIQVSVVPARYQCCSQFMDGNLDPKRKARWFCCLLSKQVQTQCTAVSHCYLGCRERA